MDTKQIKEILNSGMAKEFQIKSILSVIAKDKKAIPYIMEILENERSQSEELILDSNMELSRALVVLDDVNLKSNKKLIADPKWVVAQIKEHYLKWSNVIKCNFNIEGLSTK